jgi:hypothetical protein
LSYDLGGCYPDYLPSSRFKTLAILKRIAAFCEIDHTLEEIQTKLRILAGKMKDPILGKWPEGPDPVVIDGKIKYESPIIVNLPFQLSGDRPDLIITPSVIEDIKAITINGKIEVAETSVEASIASLLHPTINAEGSKQKPELGELHHYDQTKLFNPDEVAVSYKTLTDRAISIFAMDKATAQSYVERHFAPKRTKKTLSSLQGLIKKEMLRSGADQETAKQTVLSSARNQKPKSARRPRGDKQYINPSKKGVIQLS